MGFFNKHRTDGATYDGQGEERRGLIDVIEYRGLPEDIVWKFPYNNITTGAQLVVGPGQEAIFVREGAIYDVFGEGTKTLDANNIPLIQKLLNLPFGGKTPFTAEVWYVNLTAKRNLPFGLSVNAHDSYYDTLVRVQGHGTYGIRVTDSTTLLRELVSTQHQFKTEDILDNFYSIICEVAAAGIQNYITQEKVNVATQLSVLAPAISKYIKQKLQQEFNKYGLQLENFNFEVLEPDLKNIMEREQAGAAEQARLRKLGATYQQERQFDVMQTAAGNEGAAGQVMGAGMGLGMGFGIGGMFGQQMNQMGGSMTPQTVPPPPPTSSISIYHVLVNGNQQGPYDMAALRQLVQNGMLTRDTYVWKNGMPQWTYAGECSELQQLFGTPPPPPPPQP
ncbi:SPFH domain-containing protein [uncultured Mediterranea sp.]|uniref:SPFH domain-containing protein n=1 Tax=uncultured Mediterranea sp. TaxID=1926662 RepID=UPI002804743E|nr:SPFH domain-containing protein [uncultured Mediterranea sp.]